MERPTCEICPYWSEGQFGFSDGLCRRRSPTVVNHHGDCVFAPMNRDGWCGEHPLMERWIEVHWKNNELVELLEKKYEQSKAAVPEV